MKYKLTENTKIVFGVTLFQIVAIADFGDVKSGDVGGWIEKESNLSHDGDAWVYGDAQVHGKARVSGDARVYGDAQVYGKALLSGDAQVYGDARVYGEALLSGDAQVYGKARVYGDAQVYGKAWVYGDARVYERRHILNVPNLKFNLTITPQNVIGGCRVFTHDAFHALTLEQCQSQWTQKELDCYKSFLDNWKMMQEK